MNKTREEKRRRKLAAVRMGVAALFILTVFLLAASLEDPPRASQAAERAAVYAASEAYDEMIDLFGDKLTADQVAQGVFEERGGSGTWNSTNATVKLR